MAKALHRLTARGAAAISSPGRHADGGGLYLSVDPKGWRRWVFLYRWRSGRREMGLGSARNVTLAQARQMAADARALVAEGKDPIEVRHTRVADAVIGVPTFGKFVDDLLDQIEKGFKNQKHKDQWRMTMGNTYCASIRTMAIDEIDTTDILAILQPIWMTKSETAGRIRGRIERVLDAAKAAGHRVGENPARFRGHLDSLLPKRKKLTRGHHAALSYAQAPAFFAGLMSKESISRRALAFLILTAARSAEVIGARWSEIDMTTKIWTVPAERMKAGKEHRVPLTDPAMKILKEMEALTDAENRENLFIFPGAKKNKSLSSMALAEALKDATKARCTVHGFRSTFRDWAGEETNHPREIIEAALAHTIGNAAERAYRRGDALEKRRALMKDWGKLLAR